MRYVTIALLLFLIPLTAVAGPIPSPIRFGLTGHWYQVIQLTDQSVTYSVGANDAAARGGYMALIESKEENDFVAALLNDSALWFTAGGNQHGARIGGVRGEGGWSLPYANWAKGEPNNFAGTETTIGFHGQSMEAYAPGISEWNDIQVNFGVNAYVLELNELPEPGTIVLLASGLFGIAYWRKRSRA